MADGRISLSKPPKEATSYTVTAPAFAAWLAAQGVPPSSHIQAWFDAMGVAPAKTTQTAAPEVLTETAPAAAEVAPVQRSAAQDAAILGEIEKLGYDPKKLPPNLRGKAGVKTTPRKPVSLIF